MRSLRCAASPQALSGAATRGQPYGHCTTGCHPSQADAAAWFGFVGCSLLGHMHVRYRPSALLRLDATRTTCWPDTGMRTRTLNAELQDRLRQRATLNWASGCSCDACSNLRSHVRLEVPYLRLLYPTERTSVYPAQPRRWFVVQCLGAKICGATCHTCMRIITNTPKVLSLDTSKETGTG